MDATAIEELKSRFINAECTGALELIEQMRKLEQNGQAITWIALSAYFVELPPSLTLGNRNGLETAWEHLRRLGDRIAEMSEDEVEVLSNLFAQTASILAQTDFSHLSQSGYLQ
jgi:hypothetical protein